MIGLLVSILLSWVLLWLFVKSSIEKLGLRPTRQRLIHFLAGLTISVLCCLIYFGSLIYLSNSSLTINKSYNLPTFFQSLWWTTKSVLFEELLFRGALLYLATKYWGSKLACVLSAVAFGVYHWFSYNIFGDIGQMATVFVLTATVGLLLAYSFIRTKSMYLQIGLHLGWNFITIIIFSQGPIGNQLLIASYGHQIGIVMTIILFLFQLLAMPVLTVYYLKNKLTLQLKSNNS